MNQSIQQILTQLLPIAQMSALAQAMTPYFAAIGFLFILAGMEMAATQKVPPVIVVLRGGALIVCIAVAPWFLFLLEELANGLCQGIAHIDPQLNWLIVNNPGPNAMTMDYSKPFATIGQYVGGTFTQTPNASLLDLGKWSEYIARIVIISIAGFVASVTVFIMEMILILQKLILVFSGPFFPIFIGCLALPSAHGMAIHSFKQVIGCACWPVGWAIGHIATIAVLQNIHAPNWTAGLGELVLPVVALIFLCFYMVIVTIGAPSLIVMTAINGNNFAHHLMSSFASAGGQHAAHGVKSASAVGGALIGSHGGPAGAATGANIGSAVGGLLSMPVTAATEAASAVNGEQRIIPSSRSAGMADAAIAGIKARA